MSIPMYNLMIGIGAIFGFLFLEREIKRRGIIFETDKRLYYSIIISTGIGLLGGKVCDLLWHGDTISLASFLSSGMTFLGGFVVWAICFAIANKCLGINNAMAFNLLAPSIALVHAFGRIGCFFGGCCFGRPVGGNFPGVVFPDGSLPAAHWGNDVTLHPTQLYEAVALGCIFIALKPMPQNLKISFYMIAYGICRFLLEFLRGDDRGSIAGGMLSPSQLICLPLMATGAFIFLKNIHAPFLRRKRLFDSYNEKA
ncbi:MAG: prolipoprotein diacylglyceryl transferase [Opitutaceae bacterium]|jgi:phosphatidylglycerol:prolipoprotein diacylglycerol transferase|nr:prolipoprotein diacylglyceryl transferase [Opitutaceae bacterium]